MARKANVTLVLGKSHHMGLVAFVNGQTRVLTDPQQIAYYKTLGEFRVEDIHESEPPKAKARPFTPKAVAVVEVDDEDELDEDEADEDELDEEDDEDLPDPAQEEESSDVVTYTKKDLEKFNKPTLVALAAKDFSLELAIELLKPDMIKAILKAQIARAKAAAVDEEEEDDESED